MAGCASRTSPMKIVNAIASPRAEMEQIIPWRELCKVNKPFYPKPKGAGRPPLGLERMLRIHFLQHWFNLSDPAAEEALYGSRAMRRFVGIDLGREPAAGETKVCFFSTCWKRKTWVISRLQ